MQSHSNISLHIQCQPFVNGWRTVFESLSKNKFNCAMEICCGVYPKVGLAMEQATLAEQIYYVDSSPVTLNACQQVLQSFSSQIQRFFIPCELAKLDLQVDILAGNHILDDLLLRYFLQSDENPYASTTKFINTVKAAVSYYHQYRSEPMLKLAEQFDRCLNAGGLLILSDYPSLYERKHHLYAWPKLRAQLLVQLHQSLSMMGYEALTVLDHCSLKTISPFTSINVWQKP